MHGALFRGTPEPLGGRGEIAANALALEIQHGESELGFHMAVLGGGQPFFVGDGIGAVDLGDKFTAEIGPRGTLQPREGSQQKHADPNSRLTHFATPAKRCASLPDQRFR